MANPLKPPCSYSFKWSFSNFWDDYPDLVAKHAEIQFLRKHKSSDELYLEENIEKTPLNSTNEDPSGRKTLSINDTHEKKPLLEEPIGKKAIFDNPNGKKKSLVEEATDQQQDSGRPKQEHSIMLSKTDSLKKSLANASSLLDFRNYFKSDILKYESEHRRLSKALGFLTIEKLHDSEDILAKAPMDLARDTFGMLMGFIGQLREGGTQEKVAEGFEKNEFREILMSFFRVLY